MSSRTSRGPLWACFAVSGAAALALEMLWMRSASLLLGATARTSATVLGCYFAGLGLGAAWAQRGAPHPVRRFGVLEIGAAAGGVWSLAIFALLSTDAGERALVALGAGAGIVAVSLAILPATFCLGASLPAVCEALAPAEAPGRQGGLVYALNTVGGAAGVAAMGFGLPAWIGVRASYLVTFAASALAGTIALVWSAHGDGSKDSTRPSRAVPSVAPAAAVPLLSPRRLGVVAAGTGALGLGLEVLWTRLFAQVLHNSAYSFAAIALVFVVAIALGAALAAIALRRFGTVAVATVALVAAAAASAAGFSVLQYLTGGLGYFGMRSGLGDYLLRIVGLAAATAGPGALAAGAVLPALWQALGGRAGVARAVGQLSAANTLGGVAGALGAGFVVIPLLGIRGGLLACALAYLLLGDALLAGAGTVARRLRPGLYAVALLVALLGPARAPLVTLRAGSERLLDVIEGPSGVVSVVEKDGDRQLRLDNFYVLGGSAARAVERRQGLVPLLLHPAPRRVVFIGLATGISAGAAPALGVAETTVVELVPEVATAARARFSAWNDGLLERPDVRLVLDDGRRFLAASSGRFDVVVGDLFVPWHAGTGSLYSRESFATVARRLAPGGLYCQWLPLYQLTREELDVIVKTFMSVFPQVSLWRDDFFAERPVVGLVGQLDPEPPDWEWTMSRLRSLPESMRDSLLDTRRGLLMLSAGDPRTLGGLFDRAPLNTDDRPLIEFLAPRLTRVSAAGDKDWFTGEPLAELYERLARSAGESSNPLVPRGDDAESARLAGTALFRYSLAASRHDDASAERFADEVRELVPEVVAAADADPPSLAAAERDLAALRDEQAEAQKRLDEMERRLGRISRSQGGSP